MPVEEEINVLSDEEDWAAVADARRINRLRHLLRPCRHRLWSRKQPSPGLRLNLLLSLSLHQAKETAKLMSRQTRTLRKSPLWSPGRSCRRPKKLRRRSHRHQESQAPVSSTRNPQRRNKQRKRAIPMSRTKSSQPADESMPAKKRPATAMKKPSASASAAESDGPWKCKKYCYHATQKWGIRRTNLKTKSRHELLTVQGPGWFHCQGFQSFMFLQIIDFKLTCWYVG